MGWQDAPIAAPADPSQGGAVPAWAGAPLAPASAPLDKYQQAAADKVAALKAAGVNPAYGPTESFMNGRLLGALPTIMGALETPASMIEHGTFDPTEGYAYAKAQQNALADAGNAAHPYLNGGASLAGGVMTGAGAAKAGLTFVPSVAEGEAAPGLARVAAGMAGDGAAYGGITGFNSGEGSNRLTDAATGALVGGATGGALPIAARSVVANPIVSQLSARLNPEGFASSQLARALLESGQTPEALQGALDNATAAGQGNFALADALGHTGQRMLTTVTKSPGPGRQAAVDFLDARQAGQSGDVAQTLADALGASRTADQTTKALEATRDADAAVNYGAARGSAGAVDVSPAVAHIDSQLTPGVNAIVSPMSDLAALPIDGKLQWIRDRLATDTNQLTDFNRVFGVKRQIDSMIGVAARQGDGATVSVLTPIRNKLDAQLADASPAYAKARDIYAGQSTAINAVPEGTAAASPRVRAADAVDNFNATPADAQQPFRVGFADPVLAKVEATPHTANAARPLLNDAMQTKLGALSLHNGPYQPGAENAVEQRLGRSDTMFQTRAKALGGSSTVENMNDQAAGGIEASDLWDVARNPVEGTLRTAGRLAANFLGGSTPAVREALGRALLMHGPDADVAAALGPAVKAQLQRAALARAIAAGSFGGGSGLTANEMQVSRNGRP